MITNLIFHHGIANVFDQTSKLIRILDVVEKSLNLPLLCQWLEFLYNLFEFAEDLRLSDSDPDLGEFELTVPTSFAFLAP